MLFYGQLNLREPWFKSADGTLSRIRARGPAGTSLFGNGTMILVRYWRGRDLIIIPHGLTVDSVRRSVSEINLAGTRIFFLAGTSKSLTEGRASFFSFHPFLAITHSGTPLMRRSGPPLIRRASREALLRHLRGKLCSADNNITAQFMTSLAGQYTLRAYPMKLYQGPMANTQPIVINHPPKHATHVPERTAPVSISHLRTRHEHRRKANSRRLR